MCPACDPEVVETSRFAREGVCRLDPELASKAIPWTLASAIDNWPSCSRYLATFRKVASRCASAIVARIRRRELFSAAIEKTYGGSKVEGLAASNSFHDVQDTWDTQKEGRFLGCSVQGIAI